MDGLTLRIVDSRTDLSDELYHRGFEMGYEWATPYAKLKACNPEVQDSVRVGRGWDGYCGFGRVPRL